MPLTAKDIDELRERLESLYASRRLLPTTHGQTLGYESYVIRATGDQLSCIIEAADALAEQKNP